MHFEQAVRHHHEIRHHVVLAEKAAQHGHQLGHIGGLIPRTIDATRCSPTSLMGEGEPRYCLRSAEPVLWLPSRMSDDEQECREVGRVWHFGREFLATDISFGAPHIFAGQALLTNLLPVARY